MATVKREVTKTVTKEFDENGKVVKETETTKEIEYADKPFQFPQGGFITTGSINADKIYGGMPITSDKGITYL